jgi:hypothetical protein
VKSGSIPQTGEEGYQPEHARTVLRVGQPAFVWTATNYVRPALNNLIIYEFHIDDLVPGGGFHRPDQQAGLHQEPGLHRPRPDAVDRVRARPQLGL